MGPAVAVQGTSARDVIEMAEPITCAGSAARARPGERPHLRLRRRARRHRALRPPARVQPDVRGVRAAGALVRGGVRREAQDRRRQGAHGEPAHAGLRRARPGCRPIRRGSARRSPPGTGARPRSTPRWSRPGSCPGGPGVARIVGEALDAGWTLAVASTSAEASVRAVLEHVVGTDRAARFAGARRRRRAGEEAGPRHLPARASSGSGVGARRGARGRGLAQRAARRGRRGPALRRDGQRLHGGRGLRRGGAGRVARSATRTASRPRCSPTGASQPGDLGAACSDLRACLAASSVRTSEQGGVDGGSPASNRSSWWSARSRRRPSTNEKYFGELDAVVGDGDFGYSMARGFEIVAGRLGHASTGPTSGRS